MKRNPLTLIRPYLRSKILIFIILSFFVLIFSILSFIFTLPFEILSYTLVLTLFAALSGICIEFYFYCKKIQKIDVIMDSIPHSIDNLSNDAKGIEQEYENCIKKFYLSYAETAELYEPTGALDSHATDDLLDLFKTINQDGQTLLMVTHSVKAASRAKRVLFIKDGKIFHQLYKTGTSDQEMYQKISDSLAFLAKKESGDE
jgi:hypothetical protein